MLTRRDREIDTRRRALGCSLLAAALLMAGAGTTRADAVEAAWAAFVEEAATPLADPADLDPLLERIGDARVVLLGEASHGTEEYYAWRAAITRRLVAEQGFDIVAVEGDWPASQEVNRFIKGLDGAPRSAREALAAFRRWPQWMWANQVTLELVEWLEAHNRELPTARRAGFYGLDMYAPSESMASVIAYLEGRSEAAGERARELYACLLRFGDDPGAYVRWAIEHGTSCAPQLEAVLKLVEAEGPDDAADGDKAWFEAYRNALAVKRAERHYRAMAGRGPESWNHRVRHMQETLDSLLTWRGPDARAVVWAHNTHVGDARATDMAQQGAENIGQLARQRYGREQVFALGFATHRGTVVAGRSWGAPRQVMEVPPATRGSFEELFHRLELGHALLLFDADADERLRAPRGHRAKGVVYDPQRASYVRTVLPERYDALIYLDETRALAPIE